MRKRSSSVFRTGRPSRYLWKGALWGIRSGTIAKALLSRFNLYRACYLLLAVLTLGKSVARLQFAQDKLGINMNRSAAITRIKIASLVIVIPSPPKIPPSTRAS